MGVRASKTKDLGKGPIGPIPERDPHGGKTIRPPKKYPGGWKPLIVTLVVLIFLFFTSAMVVKADEIKLPMPTCPSESGFVYGKGMYWHLNIGIISDYYNNKEIDIIKKNYERY